MSPSGAGPAHETIRGIGVDLAKIPRMRQVVARWQDRFLRRVFTEQEIAYCQRRHDPIPHLAARFAAKEAISKAFGTGIGAQLSWQDMEIRRKESGEPFVVLHGKGKVLFESRGAKQLHISLSHTEHYAAATAILEG